MVYIITEDQVYNQAIESTSTTQNVPLGTRVTARNSSTDLVDEFIYAIGVASTAANSIVYVDPTAFTTSLATGAGGGIQATAMSANVASQYGWYKINQPANGIANVTAATLTVTSAYAGKIITLNRAGGIAVTLPEAVGSGNQYRFYVGTTFTSDATISVAGASGDIYVGGTIVAQDSADTAVYFESLVGTSNNTITLNGSTKGGIEGDFFEIVDIADGKFMVKGTQSGTGTEVTPFSAV